MNSKLLPLLFFHGLDKLIFFSITPNAPYSALRDRWLSESDLALYFVIQIFCYRLFPLVGGFLADRFDKYCVILFGSVLQAIGFALLCVTTSSIQLLIAGGIVGIGGGILNPAIYASISQFAGTKSEYAFSIHYLLINLGAMLGPMVIWPLFASQSLYLLIFLTVAFGWMAVTTSSEFHAVKLTGTSGLMEPLRDHVFLQVLLVFSGIWACYTMIFSSVPLISSQLGTQFEGNVWLGLNSFTVLCAFIWGALRSKSPQRNINAWNKIFIGLWLTIIGILCAGAATHISTVVLGVVLLSIGELMAIPLLYSFVSNYAPANFKSRYFGFVWVAGAVGEAGAQYILWVVANPRIVCFVSAMFLILLTLSNRSLRRQVQAMV
ncbi:MFS transporter [Vogesella sp. DC21W]|uniref:MFS transporter n=1 Tax=Vogesella aquatica TaxID=2984206 RepID=A0ABT5IWM4_9NEIS|nr:MFS transporter [Vogesella aquatica]MDC7716583.1 MFS transporter [Vogesella aquatica]